MKCAMGWYSDNCYTPTRRVYSRIGPVSLQHWWCYSCLSSTPDASLIPFVALAFPLCLRQEVQRLTKRFPILHVRWTGDCASIHWDIHRFIGGFDLPSMKVRDCLKLVVVISCIFAEFHLWPRWSLVLFPSCCCHVVDICTRCTANRVLQIRLSGLMAVFIPVHGASQIGWGIFKTLHS